MSPTNQSSITSGEIIVAGRVDPPSLRLAIRAWRGRRKTPPPVPDNIARALDAIAGIVASKHAFPEERDDLRQEVVIVLLEKIYKVETRRDSNVFQYLLNAGMWAKSAWGRKQITNVNMIKTMSGEMGEGDDWRVARERMEVAAAQQKSKETREGIARKKARKWKESDPPQLLSD